MTITLKSYKGFYLKLWFLALGLFLIMTIWLSIVLAMHPEEEQDNFGLLIYCIVVDVILLLIILYLIFSPAIQFVFREGDITVLKKGREIDRVWLGNVEKMIYYPYRLRYVVTIYFGELREGGAWSLHLLFENGTKKTLRFFSKRDILKLKELYPDILEIR